MHRNHREHQALLNEINHPHELAPVEKLEAGH
jgi:hypothetical protein